LRRRTGASTAVFKPGGQRPGNTPPALPPTALSAFPDNEALPVRRIRFSEPQRHPRRAAPLSQKATAFPVPHPLPQATAHSSAASAFPDREALSGRPAEKYGREKTEKSAVFHLPNADRCATMRAAEGVKLWKREDPAAGRRDALLPDSHSLAKAAVS